MIPKLSRLEFDHANGSALHVRADSENAAPAEVVAFALSTTPRRVTALAELSFTLQPGEKLPASIDIAADVVSQSRVLGDISPLSVIPGADGTSGPIVLELPAIQLHEAGIGRYDVKWNWRCRPSGSSEWSPFDTTSRVVYVTLAPPSAPWSQATDAESQLCWPWTNLLKHVCHWAAGVTIVGKVDAAALDAAAKEVSKLIEAAVYNLGRQDPLTGRQTLLTYGAGGALVVGESPPVFKASALLRVLDEVRRELPMTVYCTECAAAVAVIANCLGANLGLLKLQRRDYSQMDLNRVWAIGAPAPASPPFVYHEITVHRDPSRRRHVFDACLQADWNCNPRSNEAKFGLTRGRRLGAARLNPEGETYLHRLLAPREILWEQLDLPGSAMPHLEFRSGRVPLVDDPVKTHRRRTIDEECGASSVTCDTPPGGIPAFPVPGFKAYKKFDVSHLTELGQLVTAHAGLAYTVDREDLKDENFDPDRRFRISVAWSPTAEQAREALAWLMTRTDRFLQPLKRAGKGELGHAAFATPDQRMVFLVRHNVLARLVSTGQTLIPMGEIATRVDRAIVEMTKASHRGAAQKVRRTRR